MKTLGQLKTSVYARGYEDDQAGRIAGFANDVVRDLMNDHRWAFATASAQVALVAGTTTYSLPEDVQHLEAVRLTYAAELPSPELVPITSDEMLELLFTNPAGQDQGGAVVWAQTSPTTVSIYPPPQGGTLTVRYQRTLAEVDSDDDALPVPDAMYDLVVVGVVVLLAKRERQWDASDKFQGEFDRRLSRMKAQLGLGQRQNAGRVGHSGDKDYSGQLA